MIPNRLTFKLNNVVRCIEFVQFNPLEVDRSGDREKIGFLEQVSVDAILIKGIFADLWQNKNFLRYMLLPVKDDTLILSDSRSQLDHCLDEPKPIFEANTSTLLHDEFGYGKMFLNFGRDCKQEVRSDTCKTWGLTPDS